jgi:predicted GIY-YIG superfamily endonuclease
MGIYVLLLQQGKYYVGRSSDVAGRVRSHQSGAGSYWTRKYPVVKQVRPLTNITGDDNLAEQAETLARMKQHGVDNVRGWLFTQVTLSDDHRKLIKILMAEDADVCRGCGEHGHYIMRCPNPARNKQNNALVQLVLAFIVVWWLWRLF